MMVPVPVDDKGKPVLWELRLFPSGMESYPGDWGPSRKRVAIDLGGNYDSLFKGGLTGLIRHAAVAKPGTDFFLSGGLFDQYREIQFSRNVFAGVEIRVDRMNWRGVLNDSLQIVSAVAARRWLWARRGSDPAMIVQVARTLQPEWTVFDVDQSQRINDFISASFTLRSFGSETWINVHPDRFKGYVPASAVPNYYRAPGMPK